ncbi:MAG: ribonuclease III [Alicyclobacillus sp.]|nr:ribonuclease III [Alicyclobacillus sp.]
MNPQRTAGDWSREAPVLALAYIGDAVWELVVREHVLARGIRRPGELHKAAQAYVRATTQARLTDALQPVLTPAEQEWVRRGRNAKPGHERRRTDVLVYRHSTGFETLLGYLYGSGQTERLQQVCRAALAWVDSEEGRE